MIPCLPETATTNTGDKARMEALLARWTRRGWLRPLDAAFAGFLWREIPAADPLLILAAALTSHQLGRGHACLDLAAVLSDPDFTLSLPPEGEGGGDSPAAILDGVDRERWLAALDCPPLVGTGDGDTPLVLADTRLYLRRYWRYERNVHAAIQRRLLDTIELPLLSLRRTLDLLFPAPDAQWQKLACALAARSGFSLITGGPGTGKTTTVVRLLALLQSLALGEGTRPLRIRLAAPTGKAAARLNESIAGALAQLPWERLGQGEALRAAIPAQVSTLHRLLGSRPDSRRFRHHAGNPLALDLLVIDEASMVDLEMMAAVLDALPARARLILLGDKDQLASVEAGAVLGELCSRARDGHYTTATCDWLEAASGVRVDASLIDEDGTALDQAVAMLRHSHRFAADSGIGRLAEAVNTGDSARVQAICRENRPDIALLAPVDDTALRALAIDGGGEARPGRHGYRHYLETMQRQRPAPDADQESIDDWARAVLTAHAEFQLLCAPRGGPWGVEGLNQRIADMLFEEALITATEGWYPGRPVLVTRNDYGLGLMNGDIGIALPRPGEQGERLAVAFADGAQRIKWVLPSRLQAVETVYALTVHKSQGSEFGHAALVLPERPSPILTRELLYTGITRARRYLTLANAGDDQLLALAVQRRVLRASGLLQH